VKSARRVRPSVLRVTCAAGALIVCWSEAAETPKKTVVNGEVAAAESIAATKRDLERIRAASDPRFQGSANASAPRISVPELRTDSVDTPPPSAPATSPARSLAPEKNVDNWLVEAMEQGARERDERQRAAKGWPRLDEREGRQTTKLGRTTSVQPSLTGEPRISGREGERTSLSSPVNSAEKRTPTTNPLAPFLGDWLTPHDYALLRPGVAAEAAGRPGVGASVGVYRNGVPSDFATALGAPTLKRDISGGFGPAPLPGATAPLRENPFLAGLTDAPRMPSPSVSIPPAMVTVPPPASDRLALPRTNPNLPPVSPKIPDVAKPRPDETYFKQLKRF